MVNLLKCQPELFDHFMFGLTFWRLTFSLRVLCYEQKQGIQGDVQPPTQNNRKALVDFFLESSFGSWIIYLSNNARSLARTIFTNIKLRHKPWWWRRTSWFFCGIKWRLKRFIALTPVVELRHQRLLCRKRIPFKKIPWQSAKSISCDKVAVRVNSYVIDNKEIRNKMSMVYVHKLNEMKGRLKCWDYSIDKWCRPSMRAIENLALCSVKLYRAAINVFSVPFI